AVRLGSVVHRVALLESVITLWVVFGLELYLLQWLFALPLNRAIGPAMALGAFATMSADAGIELAARRHGEPGLLVTQLRVSAGMNAFVAICALGIVLAGNHPPNVVLDRPLTTTEWTVVTIALGVGGGTLFHLFLGGEQRVDRLFIALAGVLVLISGAATYLQLSPLLSTMFFGAMLVNTSRHRAEIAAALARVERPLYFVLLIFAGATWAAGPQGDWVLPVLLFLAARIVAKVGGARLAARANDLLDVYGRDWGRALLGQGGIVLAMALSYKYENTLALPNVVFTTAVVSVLLTGLASGRFASAVLSRFAHLERGASNATRAAARVLLPHGGTHKPGPVGGQASEERR
ncbi:MAG TPA: hypothetical protein VFN38_05230, partial [Gemmatimonadaceae bacterium]|nr:hypothetical protein [Gemmatimonadaceae bacterium]